MNTKTEYLPENLFVCFDCGTAEGHYHEFFNNDGYENAPCTSCGSGKNTLPLYYLQDMTIPELQRTLSEYAESSYYIPILDYTFQSLKLPDSLKCDHKLSN